MHFLSDTLETYIEQHSDAEPILLQELSRETHVKVIQPRMITGHFQGRFLSLLSKILAPKKILEIGTYTGYSALCLAEGLIENGTLETIEVNPELAAIQKKYFDKSDYSTQIKTYIGDALDIIPTLEGPFDLVFIDAEKKQYDAYFEAVIKKSKSGTVILSDNVLWTGKVVEPLDPKDKTTKVLLDYNKKLAEDPRVQTSLLPIRDGLTMSRVI
ncbi:MAG: O-methyltransferase [Flavobacteriaceae bacterium]|jgi:caffeoyl-CoA O-methyltransferase|nr:O-methyltransferase [Flavobacteriaceae bacterium]MDG1213166.1 O-methyltransferase [Flavobacteriaceae bacterium]MDG1775068.1 O-methyltransferase [Flavobacteriaceae bacterium]MDG2318157.1 O-methyltransferase [Flavobacteriaceae bacterium]